MSDHDKELKRILSDSGTIGKLRQRIIALLLMVEEISAAPKMEKDVETEHARQLIEKLELLLHEFSTSQKIADKILVNLSPEKRMIIQRDAPELFDIFGWHDKISEDGELKDMKP